MRVPQIVTKRGSGERNGAQRRAKINFGKTMIQTLELLQLAKRHISGQSLNSAKIKPLASVLIEFCLSENVSE